MNVEAKPEAIQDLARHGIRAVPAVIVGDRAFHGWNPQRLAQFVGVEYSQPERLSSSELAGHLDRILQAAQRAIRTCGNAVRTDERRNLTILDERSPTRKLFWALLAAPNTSLIVSECAVTRAESVIDGALRR